MDFKYLWELLEKEVPARISKHNGLNYFIKNRAKFEGWFKVELCDILSLSKRITNITPEKDRIDIVFDDWALELKTANTNYSFDGVVNKHKPITKNIKSITKDIEALKENKNYTNKAVVFIVFPLSVTIAKEWKNHISKIEQKLQELKEKEFKFKNGINAVLYCGLV